MLFATAFCDTLHQGILCIISSNKTAMEQIQSNKVQQDGMFKYGIYKWKEYQLHKIFHCHKTRKMNQRFALSVCSGLVVL